MFSFLLGRFLKVELLGHRVNLYLTFKEYLKDHYLDQRIDVAGPFLSIVNYYQIPFIHLFIQLLNKYLLNMYCLLDSVVNKIGNTIRTLLGRRL